MSAHLKQRQWLYLLAALVLFMQSFAVWHDVSHPFHTASEQCDRLEGVSHTPTLDLALSSPLEFNTHSRVIEPVSSVAYISTKLRDNHNIRAPPHFS
ncbi:MAG: hypothetical protein COA90_05860 [Gammaproteobacteria bacterium]|nr:MAG: hypothetical protein COA90_05860 [Gammaproteobacteria bacterium]